MNDTQREIEIERERERAVCLLTGDRTSHEIHELQTICKRIANEPQQTYERKRKRITHELQPSRARNAAVIQCNSM